MTPAVVRLPWLTAAVTSVRTETTAAALTTLVGFGAVNVLAAPQPEPTEHLGLSARPLDAMMVLNRCSFTGFDRDVIPSKAIVRTAEGETRLVSFEHGWAVFSGEAAGELVAVCLGPEKPVAAAH